MRNYSRPLLGFSMLKAVVPPGEMVSSALPFKLDPHKAVP